MTHATPRPLKLTGEVMLDRRGYLRSPATQVGYRRGLKPANAGRKFPPEPLTADEVLRLLDQCGDTPTGRRHEAMIVLMWRTGLRCAEVLDLVSKDVDLDHGRLTVLHGKGDKRRMVALDIGTVNVLRAWEADRAELGLSRTDAYFPVLQGPTKGMRLGDAYLRELLHRLGKRAGIEKRVHPHCLRHSFAFWLLEQGVELAVISKMLGHSNLAITDRYANHINPATAIARMHQVAWPALPERSRR